MKKYNSLNNNKKHKILFVCLGNICRSPMAEEVFRSLANRSGRADEFVADSAGLIDFHEGELPDSRMRAHASRRGLPSHSPLPPGPARRLPEV
jgi:protein-tyrosine phosphatase